MKKQQRIEQILLSLKKCDYLTREQLQRMHKLGQNRNAQKVLRSMNQYLSYFSEDRKKVYYLNAAGREFVQADKIRKKTAQVNHFLMRNDLYISLGRPTTWRNEVKITLNNTSLVSDAAYMFNKIHHFVEIDNKQSMQKNVQKIKKYRKLSTFNPQFQLVWVTTTLYRRNRLEKLCEGMNYKILLWEDLK